MFLERNAGSDKFPAKFSFSYRMVFGVRDRVQLVKEIIALIIRFPNKTTESESELNVFHFDSVTLTNVSISAYTVEKIAEWFCISHYFVLIRRKIVYRSCS